MFAKEIMAISKKFILFICFFYTPNICLLKLTILPDVNLVKLVVNAAILRNRQQNTGKLFIYGYHNPFFLTTPFFLTFERSEFLTTSPAPYCLAIFAMRSSSGSVVNRSRPRLIIGFHGCEEAISQSSLIIPILSKLARNRTTGLGMACTFGKVITTVME